uniref:Uncharacterized protein n=1 Tax=Oryza meridionalis TaxID=40149 RepID=A0A0E0F0G8_9ORYZ
MLPPQSPNSYATATATATAPPPSSTLPLPPPTHLPHHRHALYLFHTAIISLPLPSLLPSPLHPHSQCRCGAASTTLTSPRLWHNLFLPNT